ncbi:MAG: hypothetical protein ACTSO2_09425 [Promethearchaeota archaeon]
MNQIELVESKLQKRLRNLRVQCLTCARNCVIENLDWGFCRTRFNLLGNLYSTNYNLISSISNNPIEKKPFFHFYPGSFALTIGGYSCNFRCPWCQNYDISTGIPLFSKKSLLKILEHVNLVKLQDKIFDSTVATDEKNKYILSKNQFQESLDKIYEKLIQNQLIELIPKPESYDRENLTEFLQFHKLYKRNRSVSNTGSISTLERCPINVYIFLSHFVLSNFISNKYSLS